VALDGGEVSWQLEDYFRVAAAMQAAAHELEVPVCWGGCWDSLLAIASLEDSVAGYVAACRRPARSRSSTARPSGTLGRVPGMIGWIKTVQGIAAILAIIFATMVAWWNSACCASCYRPSWRRFTARSRRLSRSSATPGSWCSTRPGGARVPFGMLWPEMDAASVRSRGGNGGRPAGAAVVGMIAVGWSQARNRSSLRMRAGP
jgi:hypothetical protein